MRNTFKTGKGICLLRHTDSRVTALHPSYQVYLDRALFSLLRSFIGVQPIESLGNNVVQSHVHVYVFAVYVRRGCYIAIKCTAPPFLTSERIRIRR